MSISHRSRVFSGNKLGANVSTSKEKYNDHPNFLARDDSKSQIFIIAFDVHIV